MLQRLYSKLERTLYLHWDLNFKWLSTMVLRFEVDKKFQVYCNGTTVTLER